MRFFKDLISETGTISTTRFVQIVGLVMAFIIAIIGISAGKDLIGTAIICLVFIVPQAVAKVIQRKFEK